MNEADFCRSFLFNIFRFARCHFTDRSKMPIPKHYLGYLTKGTCTIKTEDIRLSLSPGDIFYIPKGLRYQSQWFGGEDQKIEFYSFGFSIAPAQSAFVLQKLSCSPEERMLFDALCAQIPFTEKAIGILYHFFGEVSTHMQPAQKPYVNPTVEAAMQYISQDPRMKISQVAARCSISESALYALFKKHIGKTPNEVRLEALCSQAVNQLSTTNRSVQQISDALGFSSTSYFRKVLGKYTGKTPLAIRKDSAF